MCVCPALHISLVLTMCGSSSSRPPAPVFSTPYVAGSTLAAAAPPPATPYGTPLPYSTPLGGSSYGPPPPTVLTTSYGPPLLPSSTPIMQPPTTPYGTPQSINGSQTTPLPSSSLPATVAAAASGPAPVLFSVAALSALPAVTPPPSRSLGTPNPNFRPLC